MLEKFGKTLPDDIPQDNNAIARHIRGVVNDKYGAEIADDTSILYGGSCKPANAKELFACPNVNGGLIGGAALDATSFCAIIDSF